ncbi:hypothetical protein [uncultured Paraglaciecola sp.]|uniref:hypothetical protein n=1 Tax=uncultured Paraglaciecola sp. TaxID=1765024 RepID=UPI002639DA1E|nr:hypothetical protein [uncultured Paraglaciecola sp.]
MNNFQKKIITDAIEDPQPLSDWELDFINDMAEKPQGYEASKKQNEILNRISQKYL